MPRPGPKALDEFHAMFERQAAAEARLTRARDEHPLRYALVMAALSWEQVDRRGWRTPQKLCAQAERLMAVGRVPAGVLDDPAAVASALAWATRDPALLECDGQGRCRPQLGVMFPAGSEHWRGRFGEPPVFGVLTPLELVERGDRDHYAGSPDLAAAEVSYQLAVDSDDADAAAVAALRLAELAERRDQLAEAASRYAEVAAMRHPVVSDQAVLWLARRAAQDGDRPGARVLVQQVVSGGDPELLPQAWDLLATLAWLDDHKDAAVAAVRRAVDAAGEWHGAYSQRLTAMLATCGDMSGAADACRTLLDHELTRGASAGEYMRLMTLADRLDEAIDVLEALVAEDGMSTGSMLLAIVSAHITREDIASAGVVLARIRDHWSVNLPEVSVRTDLAEASLAAGLGDDERAAELYRSLTDSDDSDLRDLARPLLVATGELLAAGGRLCVVPGVRPLLEYLSEGVPPATATWAARSLAHLATMDGRADDAEAAVRLAARHLSPGEVAVLRAQLRRRRRP